MASKKMEVYIDVSSTATPDYEQLCSKEVGFNRNETLETWYNICSDYANNRVTALDPTWTLPFKIIDNADLKEFILNKQLAVGDDCEAKFKLVDLFRNKEITFKAVLSNINYTYATAEELDITMDIKVADNSTFDESTYTPPSV